MLKTADWLIDLGPAGGEKGGYVIAVGTPEDLAANASSSTGQFLKPVLARSGKKGARGARSNGSLRTKRAARQSARSRVAVG